MEQLPRSPDGEWWWSGSRWEPAWSADRAWWFDGAAWQPSLPTTRHKLRMTRTEVVVAVAWFVLWILTVAWVVISVPQSQDEGVSLSTGVVVSGLALLAAYVLGLVITAAWLGARGRWATIGILTLYVTALLLAAYVVAMLAVPVPAGEPDVQDDAAGAGLVILAVPTALVVAALAGMGTGIGAALRALRWGRTSEAADSAVPAEPSG